MKVTVLGCSGTYPGPGSPCSSYLFEHDGFRLLVDAGNGSTGSLQRSCSILDLDAVAISHLHGDHFLDLITLTYARRYHPDGQAPLLPVHGPTGMGEQLGRSFGRDVTELFDSVYAFSTLSDGGDLAVGPFRLQTAHVNHPVETNAMRISAGGRTVAYSADTGRCDALVDLARGADVFLCEASYHDGEDNPPGIHLTGSEAGDAAARAGVGRLILTHLVPWGDPDRSLAEAATRWDGPLERAVTDMVVEL